jgi:hypothetical protein
MSKLNWNDGHAWKFKHRQGNTITLKCAVCTEYIDVPFEEAKDIYDAWYEANKEILEKQSTPSKADKK